MSNVEDKLRSTLAAMTGSVTTPPDGAQRAQEIARGRRRTRVAATASGVAALTVCLIVAAIVALRSDPGVVVTTRQRVESNDVTTPQPKVSSPTTVEPGQGNRVTAFTGAPNQVFVSTDGGRLLIVDATNGGELVDLTGQVGGPGNGVYPAAVNGNGVFWYTRFEGTVPATATLTPDGQRQTVASNASAAALSSDGRRLAYATRSNGATSGSPDTVVVRDLSTNSENRWTGLPASSGNSAPDGQGVTSLAWGPNNLLAVAYTSGFEMEHSAVLVLDTATDQTFADARLLPGELRSPAWTADGTLLAVGAPAGTNAYRVLRFSSLNETPSPDPALSALQVEQIQVDRSGQHVIAIDVNMTLYAADTTGHARRIADHVNAAAW
jgi:hypothetical protein